MEVQTIEITKVLKEHTIFENVSLSLYSGNIYGIHGHNGCGKTMLMRAIAGLLNLTSGIITIDGQQLKKDFDFPSSMGFLLENPAFLDDYSGFENLHFLATINKKVSNKRIEETLERVGLNPAEKKLYKKYSLGMKQKLGIAAAIMEYPDLILLDEPTNALDSSGVSNLIKILDHEKKRGALIIIASHDQYFLNKCSDSVIEMENGRVLTDGSGDATN